MKILALALVFFPLILLARDESVSPADAVSRVRIGILSRNIRLLGEGSIRGLHFAFPPGARAVTQDGGERPVESLTLGLEEGRMMPRSGDGSALEGDLVTVRGGGDDETFSVEIDGLRRWYPLPLEIRRSGGAVRVIVSEDPARYAADSATAEYGPVGDGGEALAALAMLVDARLRCGSPQARHGDFDFCDLTHCQVYRGRLTAGMRAGAEIACGTAGGERFFFHARCGGSTLDGRVFGGDGAVRGVRDRISWSGETLCGDTWESSVSERELAEILLGADAPRLHYSTTLDYSRKDMLVRFRGGGLEKNYAPESFRLAVNRVKGWSFIKSNNYAIGAEKSAGIKIYRFRGSGLGHGAGLCQTGALALARRGYSRHEILAHYFPGITFTGGEGANGEPGLSYMIFSLHDGAVERTSHEAFAHRSVPAGSLFKLVVALYLAGERGDLLTGWRHTCVRNPESPGMPRCWHPTGHGPLDLRQALAHSCNTFFASLHARIAPDAFRSWVSRFARESGVEITLPRTDSPQEWARLLSGLDSRVRFTVPDLVRLTRLLGPADTDDALIENFRRGISPGARALIGGALADTMKFGTAAQGTGKNAEGAAIEAGPAWGKTATAADGTNRLVTYGVFIGGDAHRGIVAVLRGSRGFMAAARAVRLLER